MHQKKGMDEFVNNPIDNLLIYITDTLIKLFEVYNEVQNYMLLKKKNRQVITIFKSGVISFYSFLRPKIIKYYTEDDEDRQNEINDKIKRFDTFIQQPKRIHLNDVIDLLNFLNDFAETYLPLTPTKYWSGR